MQIFISFIVVSINLLSYSALAKNNSVYADTKKVITQPKVVQGDTVYSILKKYGFNDKQRRQVTGPQTFPADFVLSPGDVYRVTKQKNRAVQILFFSKSSREGFTIDRISDDEAKFRSLSIQYEVKPAEATGRIRGSIVEAISKVLGDDRMAYRFMDAYLLDYNLVKEIQKNAFFRISYEKLFYQGSFVRLGEIRTAELELGGEKVVRHYRELKSGGGIFYDPRVSLENRRLFAPVDNIRITSLFQRRRYHPIKKHRRAHLGVDFEMPEGAAVYATADGVVLRSGKNRAAGKFVVLRHNDGLETYYDHLSSVRDFSPGQRISAGQILGQVGCTGYCTKPHLHFAVKRSNQFINPIYLMKNYSFHQRQDVMNLVAQNK